MSSACYYLYGSPASLYSGKLRSYLRKKPLAFVERFTSHPHYQTTVLAKAGVYAQPTLACADGTVVQDTTGIIDYLELQHSENSCYPAGARQRLVALLFELYGDEGLLKAAMHYRWAFPEHNRQWIITEFARFCDPNAEQSALAQATQIADYMPTTIVPPLGVNPHSIPAIEASYLAFLDLFEIHCQRYPYLLGGRPSIGDFGLMAPLYAHLGRDPYPASLMKQRAPSVYNWVERMNAADAGMAEFADMPEAYLDNDEIPETLIPLIQLIAQDYMPELASSNEFMRSWLSEQGDIPAATPVVDGGVSGMGTVGALGEHTVTMRGVPITQVVRHYSLWMYQRVWDQYASLSERDKSALDEMLADSGILPYLSLDIARRIERVNNIEVFA